MCAWLKLNLINVKVHLDFVHVYLMFALVDCQINVATEA